MKVSYYTELDLKKIEAEEGDMYLSPPEILAEMEKYDFYDLEGLEKSPAK